MGPESSDTNSTTEELLNLFKMSYVRNHVGVSTTFHWDSLVGSGLSVFDFTFEIGRALMRPEFQRL